MAEFHGGAPPVSGARADLLTARRRLHVTLRRPDWRLLGRGKPLAAPVIAGRAPRERKEHMVALVALVLILAILGGLGFAVHVLWYVLIFAVLLWLIGFFIGGIGDGGRRRWYGR